MPLSLGIDVSSLFVDAEFSIGGFSIGDFPGDGEFSAGFGVVPADSLAGESCSFCSDDSCRGFSSVFSLGRNPIRDFSTAEAPAGIASDVAEGSDLAAVALRLVLSLALSPRVFPSVSRPSVFPPISLTVSVTLSGCKARTEKMPLALWKNRAGSLAIDPHNKTDRMTRNTDKSSETGKDIVRIGVVGG